MCINLFITLRAYMWIYLSRYAFDTEQHDMWHETFHIFQAELMTCMHYAKRTFFACIQSAVTSCCMWLQTDSWGWFIRAAPPKNIYILYIYCTHIVCIHTCRLRHKYLRFNEGLADNSSNTRTSRKSICGGIFHTNRFPSLVVHAHPSTKT